MRPIYAETLKQLVDEEWFDCQEKSSFFDEIDRTPTIDAVPVVRCKECKEYIPWTGDYICGRVGSYWGNTKPDDFCSFGERSEE